MSERYHYWGYTITHDPKPIPDRSHDWNFEHVDYDGAPDSGDRRCGTAYSLSNAIRQIGDQLLEKQDTLIEALECLVHRCDAEDVGASWASLTDARNTLVRARR